MFNFGENSPTYSTVQIFTLDYVITGYLGSKNAFNYQFLTDIYHLLVLQNARITPLRLSANETEQASFDSPYTIVYRKEMIAIHMLDDPGRNEVMKRTKDFSHPLAADVYAGPYKITGTILTHLDNLIFFNIQLDFPMKEAEICCTLPGSAMKPIQSPYLLMVGDHKQMITARPG